VDSASERPIRPSSSSLKLANAPGGFCPSLAAGPEPPVDEILRFHIDRSRRAKFDRTRTSSTLVRTVSRKRSCTYSIFVFVLGTRDGIATMTPETARDDEEILPQTGCCHTMVGGGGTAVFHCRLRLEPESGRPRRDSPRVGSRRAASDLRGRSRGASEVSGTGSTLHGRPGSSQSPLRPDEAGYLIVAAKGSERGDLDAVLRTLMDWAPAPAERGASVWIEAERNPYLSWRSEYRHWKVKLMQAPARARGTDEGEGDR